MGNLKVKILRDTAKNPNVVILTRNGRTVTVKYDGDNLEFSGDSSQFPSIAEVLQLAYPYELESQTRPAWYDRNPITILKEYIDYNIAPHAATKRWDYIVPMDRKAVIELIQLRVMRAVAAAPEGLVLAYLRLTPDSGTIKTILNSMLVTNNVGDTTDLHLGRNKILYQGEELKAVTSDSSTGGSIHYQLFVGLTEFDA